MLQETQITSDPREYGNTFTKVRGYIPTSLILGAVTAIIGYIGRAQAPHPASLYILWVLLFIPLLVLSLFILPTLLFHIRCVSDRVQHVFAGRWILSDYPRADLLRIRRNHHACVAVLEFTNNRSIHFAAASLGEVHRMIEDLTGRREDEL